MDRTAILDRPGWEQIRFKCFHGHRHVMRGVTEVIEDWEARARMNPCKLTNCPERVRPTEE